MRILCTSAPPLFDDQRINARTSSGFPVRCPRVYECRITNIQPGRVHRLRDPHIHRPALLHQHRPRPYVSVRCGSDHALTLPAPSPRARHRPARPPRTRSHRVRDWAHAARTCAPSTPSGRLTPAQAIQIYYKYIEAIVLLPLNHTAFNIGPSSLSTSAPGADAPAQRAAPRSPSTSPSSPRCASSSAAARRPARPARAASRSSRRSRSSAARSRRSSRPAKSSPCVVPPRPRPVQC
jgi:hypothetical protein